MRGREGWKERSGGRERWGITKERVRGRLSQQKERKATQMLAIVLGEQRDVIQVNDVFVSAHSAHLSAV